MTIDLEKFRNTEFNYRTMDIKVPELKEMAKDGAEPVWKIRGLTGAEMAKVRDAVRSNMDLEAIVDNLTSPLSKKKAKIIKDAFGISDSKDEKLSDDYIRRLTILHLGSVDPIIEKSDAVKLAEVNGVVFQRITEQILILSGQGMLGESKASGTTSK